MSVNRERLLFNLVKSGYNAEEIYAIGGLVPFSKKEIMDVISPKVNHKVWKQYVDESLKDLVTARPKATVNELSLETWIPKRTVERWLHNNKWSKKKNTWTKLN